MSEHEIKRALISVHDKTGIVEFAQGLVDLGIEIVSTGGTAELLSENEVPVTLVEEVTGFPEMLDGRVKTLHPKIHAAILADRDNPDHLRQLKEQGIEPIGLVVVNLYPFENTIADPNCGFDEAIEMIDIGGPCLLRAAAKNHAAVLAVSRPDQYAEVLARLREPARTLKDAEDRRLYAEDIFRATTSYDSEIATWLGGNTLEGSSGYRVLRLLSRGPLKYGENPHQKAESLRTFGAGQDTGLLEQVSPPNQDGPALSFNNLTDATAALDLCEDLHRELTGPFAAVLVKHANACGAAFSTDQSDAYRQAYGGDPRAAMGGVLAVNFKVTAPFAESVVESLSKWGKAAGAGAFFLEVWVAPGFEDDAVKLIADRKSWGKRVRLLACGDIRAAQTDQEIDIKRVAGGLLFQDRDSLGLQESSWTVATKRHPSASELADLRLAWLVAKHTKSNAISICRDGMLIGNGAGQMSRVMSCRVATWLAEEAGHAEMLDGAVAASDGFFPFPDGPELLIKAGVRAIIQPGGSKHDAATIAACDQNGVSMILTGTRHFKH